MSYPSDVWSAGCVFAELYLGSFLFYGKTGPEVLQSIYAVLGVPSAAELKAMHVSEEHFRPADIQNVVWPNAELLEVLGANSLFYAFMYK